MAVVCVYSHVLSKSLAAIASILAAFFMLVVTRASVCVLCCSSIAIKHWLFGEFPSVCVTLIADAANREDSFLQETCTRQEL